MNPLRHQSRTETSRPLRRVFAAIALAVVAATASGCVTQNDILKMPTLKDVEPIGPEGRRCYDRCSHIEATCRHMCPQYGQLCFDDCEIDTKFCLYDCPELRRPGDK